MLLAITTARRHDAKEYRVVAGPEIPLDEQKARLKGIAGSREHPEFCEVQLWDSLTGVFRTLRFRQPAAAPDEDEQPEKSRSRRSK